MLYKTAARAEEILTLDIDDLDLPNKRARVVSKGGKTEWLLWQTGTALLPRPIADRTRGPVLLPDRKPTRAVATNDLYPVTGRTRRSYRRAAELFEETTRPLADPIDQAQGWTLHQLRHSMLTHEAENGASTQPCWPAPGTPRCARPLRQARPRNRRRARRCHRSRRPPTPPTPSAVGQRSKEQIATC